MRLHRLSLLILLAPACANRTLERLEPDLQAVRAPPAVMAPADARGWYLQAIVLERRGDTEGAEQALAWAVRLDRADPLVHLAVGRFYERQGRWPEAVLAYEEAVAVGPEVPEARLALGVALAEDGRTDLAVDHLRAAGEADLGAGWRRLAELHLDAGDRDSAAAAYERWRALPLEGIEAVERGRLALRLGRDGEAVDDLVTGLDDGAGPDVAELLVDAAGRSCRLGTAWAWATEQAIARRAEDGWGRVAVRIGRSVGDTRMVEVAADGLSAGDLERLPVAEAAIVRCDPLGWVVESEALPATDAVRRLERALDAAPLSPVVLDALAAAYHVAGMHDRAEALQRRPVADERGDR